MWQGQLGYEAGWRVPEPWSALLHDSEQASRLCMNKGKEVARPP